MSDDLLAFVASNADWRPFAQSSGMDLGYSVPNATRTCDQCGRVGSRGFVTIPRDHEGSTDGIHSFTVCKAGPACRRRRKEASYPDD